jgi:hypothetical protein
MGAGKALYDRQRLHRLKLRRQDIYDGGYVAKLGQWNRFDKTWTKLLRKHGISYFHSKEMAHRENEFRDWDDFREMAFCAAAEKLCRDHGLLGFTSRIDFADYKTHYREYRPDTRFHLDSIYGLAFRYIVAHIPNLVKRSVNREDLVINFILENSTYFGDGLRVFNDIRKKIPELRPILRTVIPGDKKVCGLQAADALATGAYRSEREGELEFSEILLPSVTIEDLRKRKLLRAPAIRTQATPESLRDIKDAAQEGREHRRRHWEMTRAERERAAILMPELDPSDEGSS